MPLISAVSDELIAMANGEVVLRGTADDVLDDERVIEAYLGTSEAAVRRSGALAMKRIRSWLCSPSACSRQPPVCRRPAVLPAH